MRIGTPGFIGERLRSARFARGMTAQTLAELTGVTPAAISQYENGHQSPAPEVMFRVCESLNFPKAFFCESRQDVDSPVFFRSFKSATKQDRLRSYERLRWVISCVDALADRISLPTVDIPDYSTRVNAHEGEIDAATIEDLAETVRRSWGLTDGPISHMAWLLENHGAIVVRHETAAEKVDAFSCWPRSKQRPFIVLACNKRSGCRSRFDVAHELAHLILHRRIEASSLGEPEVLNCIENQADFFAGALLVPATAMRREIVVPDLNCFLQMKRRWHVSIAMLIVRAGQLDLLTARQQSSLWKQFSARRWKKREPLDDELPVEEPKIIELCLNRMAQMDSRILAEFVNRVRLRATDIESTLGLRPGALHRFEANEVEPPSVSVLKFPSRYTDHP